MAVYHFPKNLAYRGSIDQQTVARFHQRLRSECEAFIKMPADLVPALSVSLTYEPDQLLSTLQAVSMLAEEYELQEEVTLDDHVVTVRFSRPV